MQYSPPITLLLQKVLPDSWIFGSGDSHSINFFGLNHNCHIIIIIYSFIEKLTNATHAWHFTAEVLKSLASADE